MKKRLSAMALAVVVGGACASAPRTRSFADLPKYVEGGNTIHLTETTGVTSTGLLGTLSPTSLTIWTVGNPRDVPDTRVVRIARPERRIGQGSLIGLGVGFGVGLVVGRSQKPSGNLFVDTVGAAEKLVGSMILGMSSRAGQICIESR